MRRPMLVVLTFFSINLALLSLACAEDEAIGGSSSSSSVSTSALASSGQSGSGGQTSSSSRSSSSFSLPALIVEMTTDEPYLFDGQIAFLKTQIDLLGDKTNFSAPLSVSGVVHAIKGSGQYWIQDRNAGIFVYNPSGGQVPEVGDRLELSVTKGEKYYEVYQITAYDDYQVVSTQNPVFRQSGVPDPTKPSPDQGKAWVAEIVMPNGWKSTSASAVVDSALGLRARNATGIELKPGVYRIRGPIHQTASYVFPDVFVGMVEYLGDVPSGSSSSLAPFVPAEEIPSYDQGARIRLGSFNIQIFGPTKVSRPNTLAALASVATNFDILAIQEVGSNADPNDATCVEVLDAYRARINQLLGSPIYDYVRGHQYAFVYRTDRVFNQAHGLYAGSQSFTYQPLTAKFNTLDGNFVFSLLTIHTSPGLANSEIPALKVAIDELVALYGDPDVICLGDFNADGSYFSPGESGGELAGWASPTYTTVIKNGWDTTVSGGNSHTYDRIQLTQSLTEDFCGDGGVFYFDLYYDMRICEGPPSTAGTAAALSDHYPVWAEFWIDRDSD